MGRLRNGYENPYFQKVSEEVVDLYGNDSILYAVDQCRNVDNFDPLYGEAQGAIVRKAYRIKSLFTEFQDNFETSETGSTKEFTNQIFVALNHLIGAGVPPDQDGDYISEGDVIMIFHRGSEIAYDIKQVDRSGYWNNADHFVGYDLEVSRNSKFVPERDGLKKIQ